MKIVVTAILCLLMLLPVFTACSSNTGVDLSQNTSTVLTNVINNYYQAYIQADIDGMLKLLDPTGPLYPNKLTIQQWRDNPDNFRVEGEVRVDNLTILSENDSRARVKVLLYMRKDQNGSMMYENSVNGTIILSFKDGAWRIFDVANP